MSEGIICYLCIYASRLIIALVSKPSHLQPAFSVSAKEHISITMLVTFFICSINKGGRIEIVNAGWLDLITSNRGSRAQFLIGWP